MAMWDGCAARSAAWVGCLALGCGPSAGSEIADGGESTGDEVHASSTEDSSTEDDGHASSDDEGSSEHDGASDEMSSGAPECDDACETGGTLLWEATWASRSGASDAAKAVDVGESGRIAMVGDSNWFGGAAPSDGFVAVFAADGALAFETELPERSRGVAVDGDDSIVVGGEDDDRRLWLRRYDAANGVVWDHVDASGESATGGPLVITVDGDIVLGSRRTKAGSIERHAGDGTPISAFPTPVAIDIRSLALVDDDVIALGGDTTLSFFWLGRMDGGGATAWSQTSSAWLANAVVIAPDGTLVASITDASGVDLLHRYTIDGELVSTSTLPQPGATVADLVALDDGGFAVVGHVNDVGYHAWVARLDVHLAPAWDLSYADESTQSELFAIDRAPDGTFVAAGSKGFADGTTDAWVLRIAP